jgi:hypothetical protein
MFRKIQFRLKGLLTVRRKLKLRIYKNWLKLMINK